MVIKASNKINPIMLQIRYIVLGGLLYSSLTSENKLLGTGGKKQMGIVTSYI